MPILFLLDFFAFSGKILIETIRRKSMNNSRKIIQNQGLRKNEKKKGVSKEQRFKALLYGGIVVIIAMVLLLSYEQLKPKLILTVKDQKLYMSDMMYDIYSQEKAGESMSSIYQQFYGSDYWQAQVDQEGNTGTVVARKTAIDTAAQRQVLYKEAIDSDYELTDEEKSSANEQVKKLREEMTDKQKAMSGLDEKTLIKILEEDLLAARYKKDMIDSYDIDDAKITASISKKDNRQYDLQYYYVATKKTDDKGKEADLPAAEKTKLMDEMKKVLAKAKKIKKPEEFTKLVDEKDKSGIEYKTENLIETNKEFLPEKILADVKKMKNGEISGVLTGKDGYFIIRMENNNSLEAYNKAVTDAITAEETKQFNEEYNSLVDDNYEIKINNSVWNKVEMGKVTL